MLAGVFGAQKSSSVTKRITGSTTNVNLFTLAGSPTSAGTYYFIINSGVVIGSSSSGTASLVSGTFPTGSKLILINNGSIYGECGVAGTGGNGGAGGHAMSLTHDITIDNTNGQIFGAGGGGGLGSPGSAGSAGSSQSYNDGCGLTTAPGGGAGSGGAGGAGGKGQGYTSQSGPVGGSGGGAGSAGGGGTTNVAYTWFSGETTKGGCGNGNGGCGPSNDGSWNCSGSFGPVGAYLNGTNGTAGGTGGTGGSGGAWGSAGGSPYYSGGAAGKAISLGGKTVTWLGGNNGTQVKGAVS